MAKLNNTTIKGTLTAPIITGGGGINPSILLTGGSSLSRIFLEAPGDESNASICIKGASASGSDCIYLNATTIETGSKIKYNLLQSINQSSNSSDHSIILYQFEDYLDFCGANAGATYERTIMRLNSASGDVETVNNLLTNGSHTVNKTVYCDEYKRKSGGLNITDVHEASFTKVGSFASAYFLLAENIPAIGSDSSAEAIHITGSIGAWEGNNKIILDLFLCTRDNIISYGFKHGTNSSSGSVTDLRLFRNSDNTYNLYIFLDGYSAASIKIQLFHEYVFTSNCRM